MSILRSNNVCLRGARVKKRTVPWVADGAAYEATRGRTEGWAPARGRRSAGDCTGLRDITYGRLHGKLYGRLHGITGVFRGRSCDRVLLFLGLFCSGF